MTLLPGFESNSADPLAAHVELVDRIKVSLVGEVKRLVGGLAGSADLFEGAWRRCIGAAARGQSEEVQAQRDALKTAFETRLALLRRAREVAVVAEGNGLVGLLVEETSRMERLKTRVFDRWETVEDLEDLAARDYPLSSADLVRLSQDCKPPLSWFEEDSKPF